MFLPAQKSRVLDFVCDRAAPRPRWEPRHPHPLPLTLAQPVPWSPAAASAPRSAARRRTGDLRACAPILAIWGVVAFDPVIPVLKHRGSSLCFQTGSISRRRSAAPGALKRLHLRAWLSFPRSSVTAPAGPGGEGGASGGTAWE